MYTLDLIKPDHRHMTLYARTPITGVTAAPSPFADPLAAYPHFRWHPLRGEWVAYAAFRQDRPFAPPAAYDPLAVTTTAGLPTELPAGHYDIAVFDNRFPAMQRAPDPALLWANAPTLQPPATDPLAPVAGTGHCEVIVYAQSPHLSLAALCLDQIVLLLEVWADRTSRAAAQPHIRYVMPFENRGAEVGVTLHHPHGQLYAYPFVPPVPQQMLLQENAYYQAPRPVPGNPPANLLCAMAQAEIASGARLLYHGPDAVAFVPACARYPYEAWVMPTTPVASFTALSAAQRLDLARALKTVLMQYDGLWQRPMPYLMAWYQAPTDGIPHPETQLHAQLTPPMRSATQRKYLAGTELGAGMYAMDALPEDTARALQGVAVTLSP